MMRNLSLVERAEALAAKTATGSITPEEVGLLIRDVTDYIASVEREGGQLGVRKIYPSSEAMRADSAPKLPDGRPLRAGNLVAIYDRTAPSSPEAGSIYVYTGGDWSLASKLAIQLTNDYTNEEKARVALIKTDAGADHYLAGDGSYKEIHIPKAPVQSVSVGGSPVQPDEAGNIDLTIPKAPVQGIAVNGAPATPDSSGIIHLDIRQGTVRSINFNGKKLSPDDSGNIALSIDEVQVDESLDAESTNAVSNAAVTTRLSEIERATIAGMDASLSEDEQSITLKLTNKAGGEVASVDLPAARGGGGGEDTQTTRLLLTTSVSESAVKVGESATLSYTYRHISADSSETPTGVQATIRLTIRRGATQLLEETIPAVSAGTYSRDLTPFLTAPGTIDVQLLATAVNAEGKTQKRLSATSVSVYTLSLASSYSVSSGLLGYSPADILTLPYSITGVGSKTITCYLDGVSHSTQSVTRSGTTNGTMQIPLRGMATGRHTAQLVAEVSIGSREIRSESLFLDFYIGRDEDRPRIGLMLRNRDGRIFEGEKHLTPQLSSEQFSAYSFSYALYNPTAQPAPMRLEVGSSEPITLSLGRTTEEYASRSVTAGEVPIILTARPGLASSVSYRFTLDVAPGRVDISEITDGLTLGLSALGRSNAEGNPATWMSNGIATQFEHFDWGAGGWDGTALKLVNGSSIAIQTPFFTSDPMAAGGTIELELQMDSILSSEGAVVSCTDTSGTGLLITGKRAELRTSSGISVSTNFATGEFYRLAFVVRPKGGVRLLEIYINGIRSGAVSYGQSDSLLHLTAIPLRVSSELADVSLRAIRTYSRALSDDELLSSYIASRPEASEVVRLYERNDILGDDGAVSMDKLRRQGKSVLRIVGNVPLVNETNNKKFEEKVDLYFYSGFGKEYDFVCKGAGLRIQGTSSTTYPRKNYRLYLDRKKKYGTTLIVGGVEQETLKYAFTPGAVPVSVFTIKADFAESSSTHNTGLAKLIDETWRKAGILTPPQRKNTGVRIAIDGFPMDAFFDLSGSGDNTYLGKYNFNNDKSGSEAVFGFEGEKCICLEFLNNSEPLALFTTDNMSSFKSALEFRYPDDLKWETASEDQKGAVRRLWSWVYSCEGNRAKFKREVAQYFNVESLTGWYILTEYFMMVDQRAKNMMLATWDGLLWWFIPYDNDTVLGVRNDGKVVYDYTIDENTFDSSIGSYAYAGHDSLLWKLVREALPSELNATAQKIRGAMSRERVLEMLNKTFMGNWSERVYNKDGDYKYLAPYREQGIDYLYSLQGARYAHRTAMITDRFALIDAQRLAGTYRADALRLYFSHAFRRDHKALRITASEPYYFGYGYTSKEPHVSGVRAGKAGDQVSLTLDTDLIVNDPQNIYGASRMAELDLTEVSPYIVGTANFDRCTQLRRLSLACPSGQTTLTAVTLGACRLLEELDVSGLRSPLLRSLDLSTNHRLTRLNASETILTDIVLSSGSPITELHLPQTLTSLKLRNLPKLRLEGIHGLNPETITRLWFEDCPEISWERLLERLPKITHLRLTGIDRRGDVAWLNRFLDKGGINASGALTSTCALVGTYRLTQFLTDEEFTRLSSHFPELSLQQPEYTIVGYYNKWRDSEGLVREVTTMGKWFNLDNSTGYGTGRTYQPSGHLIKIREKRHRWRGIEEKRGEMIVYPLHDDHSGYYADSTDLKSCTPTDLGNAAEGGLWVNEPHYWYKGIHDGEAGIDYQVYSSSLERPSQPEGRLFTQAEIVRDLQPRLQHYIRCPRGTKADGSVDVESLVYKHLAAFTNEQQCNLYSIIKIPVEGYKRVRFPLCNNGYTDTDDPSVGVYSPNDKQPAPYNDRYYYERGCMISAVFTNAAGKVIRIIRLSNRDYPVMYRDYTASIPEGATHLYTSVLTEFIDEEMDIWLTHSDNPADWEPHWQEHKETWIAATPLHWQTGDSLPTMRISPEMRRGRTDSERWIFFSRHQYYDQVSYEDFKDLRNLLYAEIGSFDLIGHYGQAKHYISTADKYAYWSLPEAGMRGTTPLTPQGRVENNREPGILTNDGLGSIKRTTCVLPTALGYTWVINGVSLPLSSPRKDKTFLTYTKDAGFSFAYGRVKNADLSNYPHGGIGNHFFYPEEWRNESMRGKALPRRIICRRSYDSTDDGPESRVREFLGGRYMDIHSRRDHPGVIYGQAVEFTAGSWHYTNENSLLYLNDTESGHWNWQGAFIHSSDMLDRKSMVPVFRGHIIRAASPAELRQHKQYKFLIDEQADFTQW